MRETLTVRCTLSISLAGRRKMLQVDVADAPKQDAFGRLGEPGDPIIFEIDCLEDRRHLPIIRAERAA